jgi:chromosome segregation ATPase
MRRMASALIALVAVVARPAYAGDPPTEDQVSRVAAQIVSDVKDADSRDAVASIGAAIRRAAELKDDVHAGKSATQKDLEHDLQELDEALTALLTMEESQAALDKSSADLEKQCNDAGAKLKKLIDGYLKTKDPTGIQKLAEGAEKVEAVVDPKIDAIHATCEQVGDLEREVTGFNASGGPLEAVETAAADSAEGIRQSCDAIEEKIATACSALALGQDNPAILEARKKLKEALTKRLDKWEDIEEATEAFQGLIKELRRWYPEDVERLRKSFCDSEELNGEGNGEIDAKLINALADRIGKTLASHKTEIDAAGKKITDAITALTAKEKDDALKKRGEVLAGKIKRKLEQVDKEIGKGGALLGSRNPKIRTAIEVGKKSHLEYQSSSSRCTVSEVVLPGKRIDCVKVESGKCTIIEIKPDGDRAMRKGATQANEYRKIVEGLWNKGKGVDKFEGDRHLKVFLECRDKSDPSKLNLNTPKVMGYPFCPDESDWKDVIPPIEADEILK